MSPSKQLGQSTDLLRSFGFDFPRRIDGYRIIASKPTRHYLFHAAVRTRAYREGYQLATALLRYAESRRHLLRPNEYETALIFFNFQLLNMLDRLDAWQEYVSVWERLRRDEKIVFISEVTEQPQRTDCLSQAAALTGHRRELIGRKLAALHSGRKIGHMLHRPQSELSAEEIRERLVRISNWCHSGQLWISTYPM